ncbi:MAG: hypothetical protein AB1486_28900 [Planctomycetota bacterium]
MKLPLYLLFVLVGTAAAEEQPAAVVVPLEYERLALEQRRFFPFAYRALDRIGHRPPGEWKLPELESSQPGFNWLDLGDSKLLLVVDPLDAKDGIRRRIYLDANGNHDLTDDTPLLYHDRAALQEADYPIADVEYQLAGRPLSYSLGMWLNGGFDHMTVWIFTNCTYRGVLEHGGDEYRVMLGDMDCNGAFSDTLRIEDSRGGTALSYGGDSILITRSCAPASEIAPHGLLPLGSRLLLQDRLFDVKVSLGEGTLFLTPSAAERFPLELSQTPERLSLAIEGSADGLMVYRPGGQIEVPAGEYRLVTYQLRRQDEEGDLWLVNAEATSATPKLTVARNAGARLEFGEPFVVRVIPHDWSRREFLSGQSDEVSLDLAIEGNGECFLTEVLRISGDKSRIEGSRMYPGRPPEPEYVITTPDGQLVSHGRFGYG